MSDSHDSGKTDVHPRGGSHTPAGPTTLAAETDHLMGSGADSGLDEVLKAAAAGASDEDAMHGAEGEGDMAGLDFDPDTLATLTALSSMQDGGEDDETVIGGLPEELEPSATGQGIGAGEGDVSARDGGVPASTSTARQAGILLPDQGAATLARPGLAPRPHSSSMQVRFASPAPARQASVGIPSDAEEDLSGRSDGDAEYSEPRYVVENGRLKRKRNRVLVSCTECHRRKQQCDRKVPCSRWSVVRSEPAMQS